MSLELCDQESDGYGPSARPYEAYETSISSSNSSSQASVFSDASSQSSIGTSVSDDFRSGQEDLRERDRICAQPQLLYQSRSNNLAQSELNAAVSAHLSQTSVNNAPSYAEVTSVPAPQRQHPRRCSVSRDHKPPQLVRQRDRKIDFVDNLVDSATQMVEVIWPLSVVPCQAENGGGRGVLPLRTYIEETLRRSRTSYSTLQVALYYLILIMPLVPKTDFTMEQTSLCPASRALMCGRRMFLAALILASKYLQDRNYSAKAWSKMSGLRICEINTNERIFLEKVNWKLHIPKPTFERWQELVLHYTPRAAPLGGCTMAPCMTWRDVVPLLTLELDTVPVGDSTSKPTAPMITAYSDPPATVTPIPFSAKNKSSPLNFGSSSQETTPKPSTILPRFLEPKPDIAPPTPALARMGPLPTPQMTPSSVASSTPAASACGSRRPSMCSAMAQAQRVSLSRCALESIVNPQLRHALSRRPSMMSTSSPRSSPESMISDRSRNSRSSSISSFSSVSTHSSVAPRPACLARQATCRNARLPPLEFLKQVEEEGSAAKPIVIDADVELTASPDSVDFSISEKAMRAPHRHSKHANHIKPATTSDKGRKRCRSHGHGRSDAEEEISSQLAEYHEDTMDVDEIVAEPSEAVQYTRRLLSYSEGYGNLTEAGCSPAALAQRVAVQNYRGNKRSCVPVGCSVSISPSRAHLYREMMI